MNGKIVYVDMFVRKSSGGSWQKSVSAVIGEKIDIKLELENVGLLPRNPIVNVVLPPLLDYVSGSASPSFDEFIEEEGYEDLIWLQFHISALSTEIINFEATIAQTGSEKIYVQAIPYDLTKDPDEDEVDVTGIVPLDIDAGGPYSGTRCNEIQFSGSADGGNPPYSWSWDFGDGSTSTLQNPAHNYVSDGSYTATLTVTDSSMNSKVDTASVTVDTADLIADANGPYSGSTGNPVSFTGSASGGCSPYSWDWDFGDGSSSNQQNPKHSYSSKGTYSVSLTVTDSSGKTNEDFTSSTISGSSFVVDAGGPYYAFIGESIQFTGSATGGTEPYQWYWDFGDGSTSRLQKPTHVYQTIGTFTVELTVIDNTGTDIVDNTQAVIQPQGNDPPNKPDKPTGPTSGNKNNEYTYVTSATDPDNDQIYYLFDWGDGSDSGWIGPFNSGDEATASHTWTTTGDFSIKVKAKDEYNVESDWSDPLSVNMPKQKTMLFSQFLEKLYALFPIFDILFSSFFYF